MSRPLTLALFCFAAVSILLASAGIYAFASADEFDGQAIADAAEDAARPETVGTVGTEPVQQRLPAGQGNYPLRWRVAWATEDASNAFCGTAVVVTNLTTDTRDVEVEWVDDNGDSYFLDYGFIDPLDSDRWVTDSQVYTYPFNANHDANLLNFAGYALVYADDPRVMVSAFMFCRAGTGNVPLVSITNIPTYPVGASMEFFQALNPALGGAPLVAVPDSQ